MAHRHHLIPIANFTTSTARYFRMSTDSFSLSNTYPWNVDTNKAEVELSFCEFRGEGSPHDRLGIPGDIYLDLAGPGGYVLYGKRMERWIRWSGLHADFDHAVQHFVFHPHFETPGCERVLFCDGQIVSWFTFESVRAAIDDMRTTGLVMSTFSTTDSTKAGVVIIGRMLSHDETSRSLGNVVVVSDSGFPRKRRIQTTSPLPDSTSPHNRFHRPSPYTPMPFTAGVHAQTTNSNLQHTGNLLSPSEPRSSNRQLSHGSADPFYVDGDLSASGATPADRHTLPMGRTASERTTSVGNTTAIDAFQELEASRCEIQKAKLALKKMRLEMDNVSLQANKDKNDLETRLRDASEKLVIAQEALLSQQVDMKKFWKKEVDSLNAQLAGAALKLANALLARNDYERESDKRVNEAMAFASHLLDHSMISGAARVEVEKRYNDLNRA